MDDDITPKEAKAPDNDQNAQNNPSLLSTENNEQKEPPNIPPEKNETEQDEQKDEQWAWFTRGVNVLDTFDRSGHKARF